MSIAASAVENVPEGMPASETKSACDKAAITRLRRGKANLRGPIPHGEIETTAPPVSSVRVMRPALERG